jgi:pyruvate dehydrogenase E2 component (dihydrolipoamide acetyltransferase)
MPEFRMPSLGADMEEGTLLEWQVKPGDEVHRGDIVATVDTSKAEIEIEIFDDGVIEEIVVPEGRKVPVGAVLAHVRTAGAAPESGNGARPPGGESEPPETMAAAEPAAAAAETATPSPPTSPKPHHARQRVSPVARRTAERLDVDLAACSGSGPGGAIVQADVLRAAEAAGAPAAESVEPASGEHEAPPAREASGETPEAGAGRRDRQADMRAAIGGLMARSKREIPHYYLSSEIDLTRALEWMANTNRERSVAERLLPVAVLLRAIARAAAEAPTMNGHYVDGEFRPGEHVHLGVAVSLRGGGLVAPAILGAESKDTGELMHDLRDLVRRARAGVLRGAEVSGQTLTVTSLAEGGVDSIYGVIHPPQVAIVGLGAIRERPFASNGLVGVRRQVTATLSADHRVSDGHDGAAFLNAIDRLLQHPEEP